MKESGKPASDFQEEEIALRLQCSRPMLTYYLPIGSYFMNSRGRVLSLFLVII